MILITGGCGFIGSAYADYLQKNCSDTKILICDRFRSDEKWRNLVGINFVDFISPEELKKLKKYSKLITSVIHLGACSSTTEKDMDFLYDNNVEFSKKIFFFCLENNIPFLYASSAATYGAGGNGEKDYAVYIDNLEKLCPLNKYGYSKQIFDLWARDFCREFNRLIFCCNTKLRQITDELSKKEKEQELKEKKNKKIFKEEILKNENLKNLFCFLKSNLPKSLYKKMTKIKYWENFFQKNRNNFSVTGFKFFNVFGYKEYHKGSMASVVFHAYNQIKATGEVKLFKSHREDYQDGEQKRDFVYVQDVCKVIDKYRIQRDTYNNNELSGNSHSENFFQLINVGTGQENSFRQLVEYVFAALEKEPKINYIDMPEKIRKNYQYFTKAEIPDEDKKFYRPLKDTVTHYVKNYLEKGN